MSNGAYILVAVVWLSVVALVAVALVQRSPKRRKPVDELEAADAALRLRIVDLEDKFETHVKREANRASVASRAESAAQGRLPLSGAMGDDRGTRLAALRERIAAKKAQGG